MPNPRPASSYKTSIIKIAAYSVAVAIIIFAVYRQHFQKQAFFSRDFTNQVNFPLYYPSSLPAGYKYDKVKTSVYSSTLFFVINNSSRIISISEQALPAQPPDLKALQTANPSFKALDTVAGQAVIGTDSGTKSAMAIIETNTTLISLGASPNTPQDALSTIVQQMRSVPQ